VLPEINSSLCFTILRTSATSALSDGDVLGKCLESLAIFLFDGDCDVARHAGVDIPHGSRLTRVRATAAFE
jgi:hypothetical protein